MDATGINRMKDKNQIRDTAWVNLEDTVLSEISQSQKDKSCTQSGQGFPDSSVGIESTCNAGDPGSIPGLGRSTGKWIGYPLQYSWTSLVAQLVKNPPAMQEA